MRRFSGIVVAAVAAAIVFAGCSRNGKVIPADQLSDIYADIFMADRWAGKDYYTRRSADTSLLYEPIFNRYGYTVRDYRASVHHYLEKPDKYSKIVKRAADKLNRERIALEKIEEKVSKMERYDSYKRIMFPKDSLLMKDTMIFWNVPVADTLALCDTLTVCDTLAVCDSLGAGDTIETKIVRNNVRRKDSAVVLRRDGFDHSPFERYEPVGKSVDGEGAKARN